MGNAESGSDDDDATALTFTACTNATVVNPPLSRPSAAPTPRGAGGGGIQNPPNIPPTWMGRFGHSVHYHHRHH